MFNWFRNLICKIFPSTFKIINSFDFTEEEFKEGHGIIKNGPYKGSHLIIMDEEEYKEWTEYKNNFFIVYENEQKLKEDFPEAKPVNKDCSGADCCGHGHICE